MTTLGQIQRQPSAIRRRAEAEIGMRLGLIEYGYRNGLRPLAKLSADLRALADEADNIGRAVVELAEAA